MMNPEMNQCIVCGLHEEASQQGQERWHLRLGAIIQGRPVLSFFDLEALSLLIRQTMGSRESMISAANRSQLNAAGFRKIVLYRCSLGHQIRLHVWDETTTLSPEVRCHNHRWDFLSLVVSGKLRNEAYDIVSGQDFERFEVGIGPPMEVRSVRRLGPVGLHLETVTQYSTGMAYFQAAHLLHWTHVDEPTATVVLQDRASGAWSTAVQRPPLDTTPTPPLSVSELEIDLALFLSALESLNLAREVSLGRPARDSISNMMTQTWRLSRVGL